MEELESHLQMVPYDEDGKDIWSPFWGNNYSSKRFYNLAFNSLEVHPIFTWLWQSKCTPKIKLFAWLVTVDRLNTKSMLQRRNLNIQGTANCVTCNDNE